MVRVNIVSVKLDFITGSCGHTEKNPELSTFAGKGFTESDICREF